MKFLLPITFLLSISVEHVNGGQIGRRGSYYNDELSYQELINMNISCYPLDSCSSGYDKYVDPVPMSPNKCSCHSQCWKYGTCCIDSPYRVKNPIYECISPGFESYYMIHRCPDNIRPDNIWKIHCEREWDEENDILMLSPVTSLDTSRTYKNYYCFRCHEATNKYLSWNLEVYGDNDGPNNASVHSVTYNQTGMTWMAVLEENRISISVNLRFHFPDNADSAKPMSCFTSFEISDCPETWTDKRVQEKCLRYRSVVSHFGSRYRNAHCALCNSVSLDELDCELYTFGGGGPSGGFFRCMIDFSGRENGTCFKNEEGTCEGENVVWNKYSKGCQEMKCLFPGYVVKNNACVKP